MSFDDLTKMMKTMAKEEVKIELMKLPVSERIALVKETCSRIKQISNMFMVEINDIVVEHNLEGSQSSKAQTLELMKRLTGK